MVNYFDLIPSESYKDYLKDNNIDLDVKLIGLLIFESEKCLEDKLELLKDLLPEVEESDKYRSILEYNIKSIEDYIRSWMEEDYEGYVYSVDFYEMDKSISTTIAVFDDFQKCLSFIKNEDYSDTEKNYDNYRYLVARIKLNTDYIDDYINLNRFCKIMSFTKNYGERSKDKIYLDDYVYHTNIRFPENIECCSFIRNSYTGDYGIYVKHVDNSPLLEVRFFNNKTHSFYSEKMLLTEIEVLKDISDIPEELLNIIFEDVDIKIQLLQANKDYGIYNSMVNYKIL